MSGPEAPVLELRNVDKIFPAVRGAVTVLARASFVVQPGEFVALTGPSGSGKTTLLNIAGLLDRPTAGEVLVEGRRAADLDDAAVDRLRAQRIGMVFQRFCLLAARSVRENVLFRFRYAPMPETRARQLADEAIEEVGLTAQADQPARLLSGGEMQRVAIARAVALPPALLLVDEPTGNLDAVAAEAVMRCFRRLHERGITIVLATHNAGLLPYCTRHLACRDGSVTDAAVGRT